jgi:hypothetical protein
MIDATTHITTSGGLISAAFIDTIRELDTRQPGTEPESFAMPGRPPTPSRSALEDDVAAAWELMLERWDAIHDEIRMFDVSQVRNRWLLPLFQVLDFDPIYVRGDVVLDEAGKLRYPLSHRGWDDEGTPYLHTVIPSQKLDERQDGGRGIKSKSPHDMVQAFLNASSDDLWAVLSNGILLRVLRDYHHTFSKGYVQFDLEAMFETRNYGDFRALYRVCHASRFTSPPPAGGTEGGLCPLEQFYKDSIATGIKVGENLRGQVRQAIETLGNGFLAASPELIRRLQSTSPLHAGGTEGGQDLCQQFYGEILRVVYRILFLLFAEQRGMMPGRDSLYAETYAIAALRSRAEGDIPRRDDFTDLWEGLKVTFDMVRDGAPALGVFGYDGMLFAEHQTPLLNGRALRNSDLLHAIRDLTLIEREGVLQRISYADLGVEELGSIYESLLDFTPRVTTEAEDVNGREIPPHTFFLDPRGSERKTTGSYYTHDSLVRELIKSALLPVARDRLERAGLPVIAEGEIGEATAGLLDDYTELTDAQREAGEEALLSLKVCDPAAGSGHFLVKANNALGAELARVRTGDEYPTEAEIQAGKRDVLARSIYAVDLNPMAVELCKVSLWINASVRDRPLSFLDHHIKWGNSLIGATPELLAEGVPYEAFDHTLEGNDRERAKEIRSQNRQERRDMEEGGGFQPSLLRVTIFEPDGRVWQYYHRVTAMAGDQPQVAREQYEEYRTAKGVRRKKLVADAWTSAFFWPIAEGTEWAPTYGEFVRLRDEGPGVLPPGAAEQIGALADRYHFFHWHLEFPDVFEDAVSRGAGNGQAERSSAGFDVVLGNPPWERIKLQEKEFFADKAPDIADARTAAARRRLIKKLPQTDPELHGAYKDALRKSEATSHFVRESGCYPLSAVGDINTYQVFAGLVRQIVGLEGRVGVVIPSGIATDYYNQDYFSTIVEEQELVSFYDFENRRKLFPEVDSRMKFCLFTLAGGEEPEAEYGFFLHTTDDLADPERRFGLSRDEVRLMNPNTGTVPVFRTRRDAELTKKLYQAAPVLVDEKNGENAWDVSYSQGLFHSSNDVDLFGEEPSPGLLPLYDGRMINFYDHRAASVGISETATLRSSISLETTVEEHQDPDFFVQPRYWVPEREVENRIPRAYRWRWGVAFKDVTSPTNERTAISAIVPWAGISDRLGTLWFVGDVSPRLVVCFIASFNVFVFDFITRQKVGGIHLKKYMIEQLPVLPPDRYVGHLPDFIVPRVVELTYTAWDLQPFAEDVLGEVGEETWARWFATDHLGSPAPIHTSPPPDWGPGSTPPPFVWDEERRARLRAELDALYGHLYGLTREELAYILDTFPIVKRKDEAEYGEYRTKRMILEKYGEIEALVD